MYNLKTWQWMRHMPNNNSTILYADHQFILSAFRFHEGELKFISPFNRIQIIQPQNHSKIGIIAHYNHGLLYNINLITKEDWSESGRGVYFFEVFRNPIFPKTAHGTTLNKNSKTEKHNCEASFHRQPGISEAGSQGYQVFFLLTVEHGGPDLAMLWSAPELERSLVHQVCLRWGITHQRRE